MMHRFSRLFAMAVLVVAGVNARAAEPGEADIDRLTDLVVQAMPFGVIFEGAQAQDPKWPLGDKAAKASAEQLACLRSELSSDGYRRIKRKDVVAYAKAHPADVMDDIRLLESGAAELFGKSVLAGAEGEASGKAVDPETIFASASAAQGMALTLLVTDKQYVDLRQLIGMGNMFEQIDEGGDAQAKGEEQDAQIGAMLMIGAMATCELPMSVLQ